MPALVRRLGLLFVGLTLAAGCGQERTTAPLSAPVTSTAAPHDLLGGLVGTVTSTLRLTTTNGVLRTTPLPEDITVVRTIGVQGGTLSIPDAGVTVTVPYGALSSATQITMTARRGVHQLLVCHDNNKHRQTQNLKKKQKKT